MTNLNRVELIGGLTQSGDLLRFTRGGYPFAQFTLAVNDTRYNSQARKQEVTTDFVSVQLWGPLALRFAEEEPRPGDRIYVLGKVDQSEYEDKDGNKVSKTRVRAHFYQRLDPREEMDERPDHEAPSPRDEPPF